MNPVQRALEWSMFRLALSLSVLLSKAPIGARRRAISLGAVLALIIAAISLVVGVYLIGTFQSVLNTSGLPAAAQTAIGSVFSTTYSAFQLAVVGLIVIAAVAILSLVVGGFGAKKGGAYLDLASVALSSLRARLNAKANVVRRAITFAHFPAVRGHI